MGKPLFSELLARAPRSLEPIGYKTAAGAENPDNEQFELDFSRLAYMFVRDRAAALLKYMLGFEVVSREPDGSRAVGIFGFKVGKDYYYVPAFFLANQIKGMDLLLSRRTNMFVPLQDSWINHIVNRQTIELGGVAGGEQVRRDFETPDFRFLSRPPLASKMSSANGGVWSLRDAWREMVGRLEVLLEKDAAFREAWGGFVCSAAKRALPFEKTGENSALKTWLAKSGGPRAVSAFMGALTTNPKYANAAFSFYPSVESLYVSEFDPAFCPKTASVDIRVTERVEDGLSDTEKKRLVRDGFAIVDTRPETDKSEIHDIDYECRFSNPDKAGTYRVLLRGGRTVEACVFPVWAFRRYSSCLPAHTNIGGDGSAYVVVERSSGTCVIGDAKDVFVRDESVDSTLDAYNDAKSLADIEFDADYLLLDEHGNASPPLRVLSAVSENDRRIRLRVEFHEGYGPLYLELADHTGAPSSVDYDTLVLPSNWRALRLREPPKDTHEGECDPRSRKSHLRLGNPLDVSESLLKHAFHKLTVCSDDRGLRYYFRVDDAPPVREVGYKQAYAELVSRFGLSTDDAETMLGEAVNGFKSRRLLKLGASVGSAFYDPVASVDPRTGMLVRDMTSERMVTGVVPGIPRRRQADWPGIDIGGEADMDIGAQNLAAQAGQLGQKKVFDHASIGGLAKLYDTSVVIDAYIPELMQALDRIGRVLFLYYWKNEDFAERYGINDIIEMEDLLRNVFKSFGELVLQLRQKAIGYADSIPGEI